MRLSILAFLLGLFTLADAQNPKYEYGKACPDDFEMKYYSRDPMAEAVVLFDIGSSSFIVTDDGFQVVFERKTRIRIFETPGLKCAEIEIPYTEEKNNSEAVVLVEGNTYNRENGVILTTKLNPTNVYTKKLSGNLKVKTFAMPDVKEGSVIEYHYKIISPFLFNLQPWEFQQHIPVIYSEYTAKMCPFYEYTYILQGASKFDEFRSYESTGPMHQYRQFNYQDMVYFFAMKNLPAFRDETFITTPEDYITKISFQLSMIHHPDGYNEKFITTWEELSHAYKANQDFGKFQKTCAQKGKELLPAVIEGSTNTLEKAKSLDRYVKNTINWDGNLDKYSSQGVKELLSRKTGNSADINLFLAGLLESAGFDVYPVLISTRKHGRILTEYPFSHVFNDVIVLVKIDDQTYLLDGTIPLCDFAELPAFCIGNKGLVIKDNGEEWVSVSSSSASSIDYRFDMILKEVSDSLDVNVVLTTTGHDGINYRSQFLKSYDDLHEELLGKNSSFSDSLRATGLTEPGKPFQLDFTMKWPVEKIENRILIAPFFRKVMTENPLKLPFRNYPVDFTYDQKRSFVCNILIPPGYSVQSTPSSIHIDNNLVNIEYSITLQEESIMISGHYEFKKATYDVSEYTDLRGYMNKIVDTFNEKVVFVKL